MEKLTNHQKWICGSVLFLGIIAAVLGFVAEKNRIKPDQVTVTVVDDTCNYPNSPALILGSSAAFILLAAQIIVTVAGGCTCCKQGRPAPRNSPAASNRSIAIICLVACWITFLNAFGLFLAGATLDNSAQNYTWMGVSGCPTVKPLVFAGGALLALATVVLGVIFYLASSADRAASVTSQGRPPLVVALGHPCPNPHGAVIGIPETYSQPYLAYPPHPPQNPPPVPSNPTAPPAQNSGYPFPKSPPGAR